MKGKLRLSVSLSTKLGEAMLAEDFNIVLVVVDTGPESGERKTLMTSTVLFRVTYLDYETRWFRKKITLFLRSSQLLFDPGIGTKQKEKGGFSVGNSGRSGA